jgi:hypothetical protein
LEYLIEIWWTVTTFLAHLAKGKVSFCHHLARQYFYGIISFINKNKDGYVSYKNKYSTLAYNFLSTIYTCTLKQLHRLSLKKAAGLKVGIFDRNLMDSNNIFSSPCQRQSELLPSLGVCRPLVGSIYRWLCEL